MQTSYPNTNVNCNTLLRYDNVLKTLSIMPRIMLDENPIQLMVHINKYVYCQGMHFKAHGSTLLLIQYPGITYSLQRYGKVKIDLFSDTFAFYCYGVAMASEDGANNVSSLFLML